MGEYCYSSNPNERRINGKNTGKAKSILTHRKIWMKYHGQIPEGYIIHHKNGNKKDNRIENLECISRKIHSFLHSKKIKHFTS